MTERPADELRDAAEHAGTGPAAEGPADPETGSGAVPGGNGGEALESRGSRGDEDGGDLRAEGTLRPRRSYLAGVVLRTFGRAGAVVGLAWLGVIAVFAVFGPWLASSHPYLWKVRTEDGSAAVSSPLVEHLGPADVTLLVLTLLVLPGLLVWRRASLGRRLGVLLLAAVVVGVSAWWFVQPPATVVYDRYRAAERAGQVEWVLRPPIPFSPSDRQRDRPEAKNLAPSSTHWMGTTVDGEDLASRMIHASRIALAVGFIATGIAVVIGVLLGGLMGYFSGWIDLLGMRLLEIFEAIPQLYLLLTIVAFIQRGPYMLYLMMVIIGLTSWTGYARFTRAEFLRLRRLDYITAARASGLPLGSILLRHMLPNGIAPVLVSASFGVASAILLEAFLSFLGLGLVDEPSWGQMLSQAVGAGGGFVWWIALYPGLAIFLTVFSYNLIGESLRDAIDPYTQKKAG
ncbi:MAG: ABC transporter permease [Planctomycetota bacterium]